MKKHKTMLICLFAAVLYLMIGTSVWADTASSGFPDTRGSITIHMNDVDTKEAVPGGILCFYQVAEPVPADGRWVYTEAFAGCGLSLDDLGAAELSAGIERYALDYEIKGMEVSAGEDAKVIVTDLPAGLYLVSQVTPAEGYSPFRPFLVSVPAMENGEYIFDVDATPKLELKKSTPPPPPPEPPAKKLPQTGQLWWPVLVLAAAGSFFVFLGTIKNRKSKSM